LWAFFADFERKHGFHDRARELFERALSIDPYYERVSRRMMQHVIVVYQMDFFELDPDIICFPPSMSYVFIGLSWVSVAGGIFEPLSSVQDGACTGT